MFLQHCIMLSWWLPLQPPSWPENSYAAVLRRKRGMCRITTKQNKQSLGITSLLLKCHVAQGGGGCRARNIVLLHNFMDILPPFHCQAPSKHIMQFKSNITKSA